MWSTAVTALLPIAIRLITWGLDAVQASKEEKAQWVSFVDQTLKRPAIAAKLRLSYARQLKENK